MFFGQDDAVIKVVVVSLAAPRGVYVCRRPKSIVSRFGLTTQAMRFTPRGLFYFI
jgi:hypothetical protein